MLITLRSPARTPGDEVVVRADGGDWRAIWRGASSVDGGATLDVEVEVTDPVSWGGVDVAQDGVAGISGKRGTATVCGQVMSVADDGVVALDVRPGLLLVEFDGVRPLIRVGDFITFDAGELLIYPTGV
ncbi:hypothetical protein FK531_20505 [Rhodococcus spelaei]|uniref:Uncharacterized protein n=1 Tax=Rhodococcus spelaei TaxID=2546320 RepID=A0A541B0G7_9NOCA|nr:hypothetical protein [Rhodococcus spelaei]TQF65808.1 hypothetical protein FK531_20505 [Rhodococcus spelaei]